MSRSDEGRWSFNPFVVTHETEEERRQRREERDRELDEFREKVQRGEIDLEANMLLMQKYREARRKAKQGGAAD